MVPLLLQKTPTNEVPATHEKAVHEFRMKVAKIQEHSLKWLQETVFVELELPPHVLLHDAVNVLRKVVTY